MPQDQDLLSSAPGFHQAEGAGYTQFSAQNRRFSGDSSGDVWNYSDPARRLPREVGPTSQSTLSQVRKAVGEYFLQGGGHKLAADYTTLLAQSRSMKRLKVLLNQISDNEFYLLSGDESVKDNKNWLLDSGITKFDLLAEVLVLQIRMALEYIILSPFDFMIGKSDGFAKGKLDLFNVLPKLINFVLNISLKLVRGLTFLALDLSLKALNLALRVVTTVLGLAALPVNKAFNYINESRTPYQASVNVAAGLAGVAAAALWIGIAAGVMTPAVLGTSALAATMISLAWPVAVGATAAFGGLLVAKGLYNAYHKLGADKSDEHYEDKPAFVQ